MRKKSILAICLVVVLLASSGCKLSSKQVTDNQTPIPPMDSSANSQTSNIALYFGFNNEQYLGTELMSLKESSESSLEQQAINELIKGPTTNSQLKRLIPDNTKASTSSAGSTLFVTLSYDFLSLLPGENPAYNNNEKDKGQVLARKKLAVMSIVNTVTEIGNFSRVQILINDAAGQSSRRPLMSEIGLMNKDGIDGVLDALPRNNKYILTPQTLTTLALTRIQEGQWQSLYDLVVIPSDQTQMTMHDFTEKFSAFNKKLETFSIESHASFSGNNSSIININYTLIENNTLTVEKTKIPFKLILSNGIWKVDYNSLITVLEKG